MKGAPLTPDQQARLQGYLAQRPALGPETVHIDLINACNLNCVTCWNYAPGLATAKPASWKAQRMEASVFARVLAEVAATGAQRIILSGGGEPFVHPRIHDFIGAVKAKGLTLTVISNGTLCDFDRLADLQVDQMLINMSSASAPTYVAYHPNQAEASFHQLTQGLASVRGRIAINLVQVINTLNAHELVDMLDLASQVGTRVSYKLGDTPPGTQSLALEPSQRHQLINDVIPRAIQRAKQLGVKHNLPAFADQLSQHTGQTQPPACFAGYLYSRVYVDGRVFFCCEHIDVGHIDEAPFAEIWASPRYDAVRQRLHQGQSYPGCARCGKHDMNFTAAGQLAKLQSAGVEP